MYPEPIAMPHVRSIALAAFLLLLANPALAQSRTAGYHTAARLAASLDSIARANPSVRVTTLATSPGGRPVQLVRIGTSDEKPALLVLAGAHGPQLASSEVALRLIRLLSSRQGVSANG